MNNNLLYGKNDLQGVLNVEIHNSDVSIVTRNKILKCRNFTPFLYTADSSLIHRVRNAAQMEKLSGTGYNYILKFQQPKLMFQLIKNLRESNQDYFTVMDMQEQFMVKTGITLFKGMEYKDLRRLQFNIEASGLSLTESEILIIAWKYGEKSGTCVGSEESIILQFKDIIKKMNPDIIESYNGFFYDFPLLQNRADVHGIALNIGRNNSKLYFYKTFIRLGDQQIVPIYMPKIWGRHCVDLYYSVRAWDIIFRELDSWKLDIVCERLGMKLDHMDLDKEDMKNIFKKNPDLVSKHCLNDCIAVDFLSLQLNQKYFYQTQMLPLSYEKTCVASASAKMTGIFLREYYRQKMAVPLKVEKTPFQGATVKANERGIFEHAYKIDVSSLYPNLMLHFDICPKSDTLKIFPKVLKSLTDLRLKLKKLAKEKQTEELKASEQAYKILINAMYGLLGSNFFNWADMSEAARVTENGRKILLQMEEWLTKENFKILEEDTDGIYVTNGGKIDIQSVIKKLNEHLPKGIDCDHEYYQFFCNILPKNYIRVTEDGKMKMSGVSFRSRAIEKFGKDFIRASMWDILYKRYWRIRRRYLTLTKKINQRQLDLQEFLQHREISKSLETYENDKKKTDQVYEALIRKNKYIAIGNKVSYYIAEHDSKGLLYKLKEDYKDDYQIDYLLGRLDAFSNRLKPLLPGDLYYKIFAKSKHEVTNKDYQYREVCYSFTDELSQEKKWSTWTRLKKNDIIKYIKSYPNEELYSTVQKFRYPTKITGEEFLMELFFDFDIADKTQINIPFEDALKVIDKLEQIGVPKKSIQFSFSGNKGFHLLVNEEIFGLSASKDLHKKVGHIHKKLIQELSLKTLDLATGNRKMLRIQNTINHKSGLYKITIPHKLWKKESLKDILDLAQRPKKKEQVGKASLVETAKQWADSLLNDYKTNVYKPMKKQTFKHMPVCVKDLLLHGIKAKDTRNKATMVLASFLKDAGVTEAICTKQLTKWTERLSDDYSSSQSNNKLASMNSCIRTIYNGDHHHFQCAFILGLPWKIKCNHCIKEEK